MTDLFYIKNLVLSTRMNKSPTHQRKKEPFLEKIEKRGTKSASSLHLEKDFADLSIYI
jgi:hypothetical protein